MGETVIGDNAVNPVRVTRIVGEGEPRLLRRGPSCGNGAAIG